MIKNLGKHFFVFAIISLMLFAMFAMCWVYKQWHRVNYDEIMLVLDMGLGAAMTDSGMAWSFIKKVVFRTLGWALVLTLLPVAAAKIKRCAKYAKYVLPAIFIALGVMFVGAIYLYNVEAGSIVGRFQKKSHFYEQEYVAPSSADIKFPQRRNVLIVALESMEKSYGDTTVFDGGLTPNITALEQQNVSFSRYESITGLTHTIAAITGMTTGLPLLFTSYSATEKMKGAVGLGTVFAENGYDTYSFFPASGDFSLKTGFMHNNGFKTVVDGVALKKRLNHQLSVYPFGGVDDDTLFNLTKPDIEQIIKAGRPYVIFMETINTHCKGYFTESCKARGFAQKTQEDIVECDDEIIFDFVKWFRRADPSAVVILVNDHPQHDGDIMKKLSALKTRPNANVFINTNIFDGADLSRPVSALDFFPTIIEAGGGIIDGCRLGLGTSLSARCAGVKTLRERYADTKLGELFEKRNDLYYKLFTGN